MGKDYIVEIFYGFFLVDADVQRFDQEEDGFFHFVESLDEQDHEVRAMSVPDDTMEDGEYRHAVFPRASNTTMYVNEDNEVNRVSSLTTRKMDPGWDEMLERFCKEHDIQFQQPEWWLCTNGE